MAKRKQALNTRNQPLGVAANSVPREKRGRTTAPETPVSIHADGVELTATLTEYIHSKLGAKVGAFALQIERVAVRFTDINGPRGGNDCECRIQIVLAGRPNIVVAERAATPRIAFDAASQGVGRAVKRDLDRAGFAQGLRSKRNKSRREKHAPAPAPEPEQAEAPAPESRNVRKKTPRSAAALEVSSGQPSRMSTRKSANRSPSALNLQKRASDEAHAPQTTAASARARRK
jgi:ribosome-associated translation inhibitor RaiA